MHYESFNKRMLDKYKNALKVYENLIFNTVHTFTYVDAFETKKHFHTPPNVKYNTLRSGEKWGCEFGNIWIKTAYTVPNELKDKTIYLREDTGARETLVYINDVPSGMFSKVNAKSFEGRQTAVLIVDNAKPGEKINIALECYAWHYEPGLSAYDNVGKDVASDLEFKKTFRSISICTKNEIINEMCVVLRMALQLSEYDDNAFLKARATALLEEAFESMILFPALCSENEIQESAQKVLKILKPLFEGNNDKLNGYAGIIGHSHMDTAWLWPINETIRKCARTYSNALSLMERYSEYKFVQSSVLHTCWMEKYYPDIFKKIKERTAEGRYEPNGAAWVECDCNITGGEYMIRQFVKGQNYLKEKLNYKADSFWLPDTFGYSAAIPQIMQGCGIKYFYTTKLDWNEHSKFPFESFRWKGIDGSEVIAHLNIIGCEPSPKFINQALRKLQNKTADDSRLVAFGYGDGGGGPTEAMVQEAELAQKTNGIPKVEYTTISEFGKRLESKKKKLPLYNGELYLELHRGTLTQMHDIKRNNRKAEIAIHNMELVNVITGTGYDGKKYDEIVKTLLKNQFHDILPGTSLKCVHDNSIKETSSLIEDVKAETKRLMNAVLEGNGKITVVNPLSFKRNTTVHMNIEEGIKGAKNQFVEDVFGRKLVAVSGLLLDGFESKSFDTVQVIKEESAFRYDGEKLTTPFAVITFDEDGYISSFIDKQSGRELRRPNGTPLNTFYIGENIAVFWDNWDIEYDQKFKMKVVKGFKERKIISNGSVEIRLRSTYKLSENSEIVQDMIAYSDSPRVDFHTKIVWNEKHKLLKVGFDVDVLSTTARSEIQFGYLDRPTTENNMLETAKFEVCNHKWTDISENRFGVAVLNDGKYGISVRESDIRLSLHTGGCRPDPSGDAGVHETTYSILPHTSFMANNVITSAYELNYQPIVFKGELTQILQTPVKIDKDNVICETVKPTENGEKGYILRLYECERTKTIATLSFPDNIKKAHITNMLEEVISELPIIDGEVTIEFNPFEIKTIKVEM